LEKSQDLLVALPEKMRRSTRRRHGAAEEPALSGKLGIENPELRKIR
jgi:hypothetical protein